MSTIGATGTAPSAQDIWSRFFKSADKDSDGSLSVKELASLSSRDKANKAISANDTDGDGQLSLDELPRSAFSPRTLDTLLSAQEYQNANSETRKADDTKAVAERFARADTDGNGVLSKDEWDAERALNMASYADTGEAPQVIFLARQGADTSALKPEDFMVGRALTLTPMAEEDIPDDLREQMKAMKAITELHSPEGTASPDENAGATLADRVKEIPMSSAFLTRLIMSLGEGGASSATA